MARGMPAGALKGAWQICSVQSLPGQVGAGQWWPTVECTLDTTQAGLECRLELLHVMCLVQGQSCCAMSTSHQHAADLSDHPVHAVALCKQVCCILVAYNMSQKCDITTH
jgi:hypothetical protein